MIQETSLLSLIKYC